MERHRLYKVTGQVIQFEYLDDNTYKIYYKISAEEDVLPELELDIISLIGAAQDASALICSTAKRNNQNKTSTIEVLAEGSKESISQLIKDLVSLENYHSHFFTDVGGRSK